MAAIELFNHTKYPDEVLLDALKYAKRKMKVVGDVAVKVMYYANSTGTVGTEYSTVPYIDKLTGKVKKFDSRGYDVTVSSSFMRPRKVKIATKEANKGWFVVMLSRPSIYFSEKTAKDTAAYDFDTMLEEMGHVWQDRNMEKQPRNWNSRRLSREERPCEVHVQGLIAEAKPKSTADRERRRQVETKLTKMYMETKPRKAPAKRSRPKTNQYGEKISSYRNMKIGRRFRGGETVIACPHCGEGSVWLDRENGYSEEQVYTHVAAYEYRRYEGTVRYTWEGCKLDENGDRFAYVENSRTIWEK